MLPYGPLSVHANTPPPWTLSLDADSTSTRDASIQAINNPTTSFVTIGAIINASNTHPLNNVYGWQFTIQYDNITVTPETSGNGPQNGVQYGAQTGTGNPNWAGQLSAGNAFGFSAIRDVDTTHQNITVLFIFHSPSPPVSIAPTVSSSIQGNLLANINFTILHIPTSPLTFTITDLIFADNNANNIPNINPGPSITEYGTTNPPGGPQGQTPTPEPVSYLIYILIPAVAAATIATLLVRRRRRGARKTPPL